MPKGRKQIRSVDTKLWLGKYKGKTIRQVMHSDIEYLRWLANAPDPPPVANSVTKTPLRGKPKTTTPSQRKMKALKHYLRKLTKKQNKRNPGTYCCRNCGHKQHHYKYEFFRAADPRCRICGGLLDHEKDARPAHEFNGSQESLVGRSV